MFDHILLHGLAKSELFGYAKAVPFFKGRKRLDFKPGLNILFGPNGCGKTTVLRILGGTMCATQGGVSTVTESTIRDNIDINSAGMIDKISLAVAHDGQPVVFCDPRQAVGMNRGHFDDDFFRQGMLEATSHVSHGQKSMWRADLSLNILTGKVTFPEAIDRRMKPSHVNDLWKQAIEAIDRRFVATLPLGQSTVLLDEPEANYSIDWQGKLWTLLADPKVAAKFQVIVATHSVFALGIPHANYIDFAKGYRDEAETFLRHRFGRPQ